ncbi:hypothetical protein ILYODFUR_010806 [Ilyodon furcidens]|uniref:Uncharacterized protein n=1 Tax=Ilyodon furcidens TaxID=33524 RepID=A0ABV0U667_9TELE
MDVIGKRGLMQLKGLCWCREGGVAEAVGRQHRPGSQIAKGNLLDASLWRFSKQALLGRDPGVEIQVTEGTTSPSGLSLLVVGKPPGGEGVEPEETAWDYGGEFCQDT